MNQGRGFLTCLFKIRIAADYIKPLAFWLTSCFEGSQYKCIRELCFLLLPPKRWSPFKVTGHYFGERRRRYRQSFRVAFREKFIYCFGPSVRKNAWFAFGREVAECGGFRMRKTLDKFGCRRQHLDCLIREPHYVIRDLSPRDLGCQQDEFMRLTKSAQL